MSNERRVLDYALPQHPSRGAKLALRLAVWVVVAVVLFVAAIALPHPEGIWYFGRRLQWLVAIDHAGLAIGPSSHPVLLGWVPLLVAKLIVYGLPVWLIWRFGLRSRRGRAAAG